MRRCMTFLFAAAFVCAMALQAFADDGIKRYTFWYSLPAGHDTLMKEMVADYTKDKPYIKIETKNFPIPADLYSELSKTSSLPDLAIIDASWQRSLIEGKKLVPVEDEIVKISEVVKTVAKMDSYKPLWSGAVQDGKLWSMPYFASNYALLYNEDMFKEYGVAKAPSTWADLTEAAKKIKEKNPSAQAFFAPTSGAPKQTAMLYQIFMIQASGPQFDPVKDGFDVKGVQRSLQFFYDSVHKTHIMPQASKVDYKNTAMFLGTVDDYLNARGEDVSLGVVRWPITGKVVGDISLSTLAIMDKKNPAAAEDMWHFIYWLTEFPQGLRWSLNTPYLPANKQVTLSPQYFAYLETHPGIRMFLAVLEKSNVKPAMDDYENTVTYMGQILQDVLANKISVPDGAAKMTERLNKAVGFVSSDVKKPEPDKAEAEKPEAGK